MCELFVMCSNEMSRVAKIHPALQRRKIMDLVHIAKDI